MQFTQSFKGVKAGEIYPTEFKIGDECPAELLDAARSLGVVKESEPKAPKKKAK